ncbi:unnamed protein product, partial [Polarella glacialis]
MENWVCPACKNVVSTGRREAHETQWCPALPASDEELDEGHSAARKMGGPRAELSPLCQELVHARFGSRPDLSFELEQRDIFGPLDTGAALWYADRVMAEFLAFDSCDLFASPQEQPAAPSASVELRQTTAAANRLPDALDATTTVTTTVTTAAPKTPTTPAITTTATTPPATAAATTTTVTTVKTTTTAATQFRASGEAALEASRSSLAGRKGLALVLGCGGVPLSGFVASALGWEVVLTDLEPVLDLTRANVARNLPAIRAVRRHSSGCSEAELEEEDIHIRVQELYFGDDAALAAALGSGAPEAPLLVL